MGVANEDSAVDKLTDVVSATWPFPGRDVQKVEVTEISSESLPVLNVDANSCELVKRFAGITEKQIEDAAASMCNSLGKEPNDMTAPMTNLALCQDNIRKFAFSMDALKKTFNLT